MVLHFNDHAYFGTQIIILLDFMHLLELPIKGDDYH